MYDEIADVMQRVEAKRLRMGWSKERLARHTGLSWHTIFRSLTGKSRPNPLTLKALWEWLDLYAD